MTSDIDSVVVGGGLSGLTTALTLSEQGRSVVLMEARQRLGGRILSQPVATRDKNRHDLGPAWIWPHNHRIIARAEELGLTIFPQFSTGKLVYEEAPGRIRRDLSFSTMGDALRIEGGIQSIIDGLAQKQSGLSCHFGHCVHTIGKTAAGGFRVDGTADGQRFTYQARTVVLAVPPRIIADTIEISGLDAGLLRTLAGISTWMAGHAKFVAQYEKPFWREDGLSGDAISQVGPLMEIHDASPKNGEPGVLFGFVGTPPQERRALGEALSNLALQQLERLFGTAAGYPVGYHMRDWAFDGATATEADWISPTHHPTYGYPRYWIPLARQGLILAGTEMAPVNGGFLEGALEAAEGAVAHVQSVLESNT